MTLSLRAQELPGVRRQKLCQKMDIKFCWQRNSKCPRYKSCSGQLIKRTVDLVQEYFGVAIPASVMCTPAESRGMIFTNDKGKEFRFEQPGLNVWRSSFDHWLAMKAVCRKPEGPLPQVRESTPWSRQSKPMAWMQ